MFIGHFAVGLAAKRAAPRTSIGSLTLAAVFLDALWPLFLLLGLERAEVAPGSPNSFLFLNFTYYPISHSLVMAVVWSVVFAFVYRVRTHYGPGTLWVGLLVLSHWVLDFLVHVQDLPLWPGGPKVGLGLWNLPAVVVVLESAMFLAGVWIYASMTRPRNRVGKAALWAYALVLALLYVADATSKSPPPSITVVALTGIVAWLFAPWAYWIDFNRELREPRVIAQQTSGASPARVR